MLVWSNGFLLGQCVINTLKFVLFIRLFVCSLTYLTRLFACCIWDGMLSVWDLVFEWCIGILNDIFVIGVCVFSIWDGTFGIWDDVFGILDDIFSFSSQEVLILKYSTQEESSNGCNHSDLKRSYQ